MNIINLLPDIATLVVILAFTIIGIKKGFVHTLIKSSSFIVTIFSCFFLSDPLKSWIEETALGIKFKETVYDFILSSVKDAPGMLLKDLSLPDFFLKGITDSQPVLEIADTLATNITSVIISVVVFVLLFILTKLALKILDKTLNLVTRLPLLKQCNSLLGALAGFVTGLMWVYVALAVIAALVVIPKVYYLSEIILQSRIASILYENNFILGLFS